MKSELSSPAITDAMVEAAARQYYDCCYGAPGNWEAAKLPFLKEARLILSAALATLSSDKLPCDVRLPPNTIIRKGCDYQTLFVALDAREKFPAEILRFVTPADVEQALDNLPQVSMEDALRRRTGLATPAALASSRADEATKRETFVREFTALDKQFPEPLPADAPRVPEGEPIAWKYELATRVIHLSMGNTTIYEGWQTRITEYEPRVTNGSVRNLQPLYAASPAPPAPAEGHCETTLTERFFYPDCQCGTYAGNLGPCKTFLGGADPLRCVYCDHKIECHITITSPASDPGSMNSVFEPMANLTGDVYRLLEDAREANDDRAGALLGYIHEKICEARYALNNEPWPANRIIPSRPDLRAAPASERNAALEES